MDTLFAMFKRILVGSAAAALAFAAFFCAARFAGSWSLLPNRDLERSSAYVREVLKIVNENYVDPGASSYDMLARLSIHGMVDSLDPHSEFLESKDNQELEEDLDGEYGGSFPRCPARPATGPASSQATRSPASTGSRSSTGSRWISSSTGSAAKPTPT